MSQSALNSAIGYIPNTSSALVIEVEGKAGEGFKYVPIFPITQHPHQIN